MRFFSFSKSKPKPEAEAPVEDKSPLLSVYADDEDMLEIVELFVMGMPDKIQALEKAYQAQDHAELNKLAHQLKGAAGGYGFPTITDAASLLEQDLKKGIPVAQVGARYQALMSLCKRVRLTASDTDAARSPGPFP